VLFEKFRRVIPEASLERLELSGQAMIRAQFKYARLGKRGK
jgi:hypothetical protein